LINFLEKYLRSETTHQEISDFAWEIIYFHKEELADLRGSGGGTSAVAPGAGVISDYVEWERNTINGICNANCHPYLVQGAWAVFDVMLMLGTSGAYNPSVRGFIMPAIKGAQWALGKNHSAIKWANQMKSRGWTPEKISEALKSRKTFPAPNKINPANPATRYVHPETGQSIIRDDVTGEIFHIGGPGFGY
jgi:hypothetical protein